MTDTIKPKHRSWVMSRIRSGDTKPELLVRSILHRAGFRFTLRRRDLPGKPDIVFPKYKAVVFVHGCFWHWHRDPECKISKIPKSNKAFWKEKFTKTASRDKINEVRLTEIGWRIFTLWECKVVKDPAGETSRLIVWLSRENAVPIQNVNVKKAIQNIDYRHKSILKLRTGSTKFCHDKNTETN
jgi:DNA mismatch endonuclease, patch repair protein